MSGFFDYPGSGPTSTTAGGVEVEACFWVTRPARDWRTLLASCQTLRFSEGDLAYAAGTVAATVSIVVLGRFDEGDRTWVEGQVLGLRSFFSGRPAPHDIVAAVESEVVRLSRDALDVLAARDPMLERAVVWELARLLAVTAPMTAG